MGSGWRGQGKALGMECGVMAGWSQGLETEISILQHALD